METAIHFAFDKPQRAGISSPRCARPLMDAPILEHGTRRSSKTTPSLSLSPRGGMSKKSGALLAQRCQSGWRGRVAGCGLF